MERGQFAEGPWETRSFFPVWVLKEEMYNVFIQLCGAPILFHNDSAHVDSL